MKTFFVKMVFFLLLFLLSDRLIGKGMSIWSHKLTPDNRIGKILDGTVKQDMIIIGSSRAAHNLMASEIQSISGISTYNLGVPGSDIDFHVQQLELLLSSGSRPRYVTLAVDKAEVTEDPSINFRFDLLYPYASDEEICNILVERGQLNEYLRRLLHTYREKSGFIEVFRPYALFRKPLSEIRSDGSVPLIGFSNSYKMMVYKGGKPHYNKINESPKLRGRFEEFVKICKKNDIKLVLVVSPNFTVGTDGFKERLKSIAGDGVICFDYSSRPEFLRKELFYDIAHLNSEGANLLSRMIGEDLRKVDLPPVN